MIEDKKYIDWLVATLKNKCPEWPPADNPDDDILWQAGLDHGVLALCHHAITNCPTSLSIPSALQLKFKNYALQTAAVEMAAKNELGQILSLFSKHQINYLLLKGTPLAYSIYPQAYLRVRCDTDVLFPEHEEAEKAADLLIKHGYQRPVAKKGGDASYELSYYKTDKSGVTHHLDMHWRINNNWVLARNLPYGELAAAAIPVAKLNSSALTLSLPHALTLCCLHRMAHKPYGEGNRLLWLYDIHLICEKLSDTDWTQFANLAIEKELCDVCLDGLDQTHSYFDTDTPEHLRRKLAAHATTEQFNKHIGDSQTSMDVANFCALSGWKRRSLFLKEHLFPDTNYMLDKYNTQNRLLLPFLYVRRLISGARKLA